MAEKEYIERGIVLEMYTMDDPVLNEVGHVPLPVIRQNIMDIPAADVAPIRRGRWIYKNGRIVCDQCGTLYAVCPNSDDMKGIMMEMNGFEKFCFNCGARMDGAE